METQNIAAEEALLSSVWVGNDLPLLERLEAGDFTDPFLQWLLLLLKLTADAGEPLDMIGVLRRARKPELLDRLEEPLRKEMAANVARVLSQEFSAAHSGLYFKICRTARMNRALVGLMSGVHERLNKHAEPAAILDFIELNCEKLRERLI